MKRFSWTFVVIAALVMIDQTIKLALILSSAPTFTIAGVTVDLIFGANPAGMPLWMLAIAAAVLTADALWMLATYRVSIALSCALTIGGLISDGMDLVWFHAHAGYLNVPGTAFWVSLGDVMTTVAGAYLVLDSVVQLVRPRRRVA